MSAAFRLILQGSQQVPGVVTSASGVGVAIFDSLTNSLSYTINVLGLDWGPILGQTAQTGTTADDITGFHFHNGARGVNAGVVLDIGGGGDNNTVVSGVLAGGSRTVTGNWETSDANSITPFIATFTSAVLGQDVGMYFNVHTLINGGGEIRGQFVTISTDNSEIVSGTSTDDLLPALGGNDTITGGLGNDTIDGGTGIDTAQYTGARSTYTVTKSGSNATVSGADGVDILSNVERLQFSDSLINWVPERDFNGDGKSDILWRNDNGTVLMWTMDWFTITGNPIIGTNPAGWQIAESAGDYSGDGKADILWSTTTLPQGPIATGCIVWQMDGSIITSNYLAVGFNNQNNLVVVEGAGDYGGDGVSDTLIRNDLGGLAGFANTMMQGYFSLGVVSIDWKLADGSGDYNGDGKSDLLWRNDNGAVLTWNMNGTAIASTALLAVVPAEWKIADGAGDYNGDGKSDILWRNNVGDVLIWLVNDAAITSAASVASVPLDWKIADGSADYNGDGKSDVLWQNDNGAVLIWTMDGAAISSAAFVTSVPADWHIQA